MALDHFYATTEYSTDDYMYCYMRGFEPNSVNLSILVILFSATEGTPHPHLQSRAGKITTSAFARTRGTPCLATLLG